jgi:hypothetical protein
MSEPLQKKNARRVLLAFTEAQALLPAIIGLPLKEIVAWRNEHLTHGRDWKRLRPGSYWTLEAAARLYRALHLRLADLPSLPQNAAPAPTSAPRGLLTSGAQNMTTVLVAWQHVSNPAILHAHFRGITPRSREDLLRVQIPSGKMFRRGQEVPARHVQADLWQYVRTVTAA